MKDENDDLSFLLGQLSGKMDGLMSSMQLINSTFAAHTMSDDANFEKLQAQMSKDKEETNQDRIKIAKITGVLLFIATVAPWIAPVVIDFLKS